MLLLLLSQVSRVRLCATPQTAAHQAPPGVLQARTLEWVAIPFSRESSQPRHCAQVYCIAGRLLTV